MAALVSKVVLFGHSGQIGRVLHSHLQANGWDGLTANQRKAIMLGIVQGIRAQARLALGLLDSAT